MLIHWFKKHRVKKIYKKRFTTLESLGLSKKTTCLQGLESSRPKLIAACCLPSPDTEINFFLAEIMSMFVYD